MTATQSDERIFDCLSNEPLWKRFTECATPEQQTMVRSLVAYAAPILDRVIETFPTYTLHNRVHAENVVSLMGRLLGEAVKEVTPLEAAMLILSAYFHDIGMVFERKNPDELRREPEFDEFLNTHAAVHNEVTKTGQVSLETAESYCRWRHAERVFHQLDKIESQTPSLLEWGIVPIKKHLGDLCASHAYDGARLKEQNSFPVDFLGDCDLPFCGILLRLADILDFDRSRSPGSVYGLLGLEACAGTRERISAAEWKKHLASEGFKFPLPQRDRPYELNYIAGPDDPGVEFDLRKFLDDIENEFAKCAQLLRFCSGRWRNFALPSGINRSNIISKGYKYGEYRFSLDHDRILELFMGDKLYDDPYVFVRELLQNAIDTSRHRAYFERSSGRPAFAPKAIEISEWRDAEGAQWVRIDDFGMGMNENLIREFLLKVGKSYYTSPEFEAEVLSYNSPPESRFAPISRFGIGLLSCFIVCDRIEINTLRVKTTAEKEEPIRLSLPGLHGFYRLQTGRHQPAPMPRENGDERGYRTECGTSIAVRLDPRRDTGGLDLAQRLTRLLFAPPVPVHFRGQPIGGDPAVLLDAPWCDPQTIELTPEQMAEAEKALECEFPQPIRVHFVPLDFTAQSGTPSVKGQGVFVTFDSGSVPIRYSDFFHSNDLFWSIEFKNNGKGTLEISRTSIHPRNHWEYCAKLQLPFSWRKATTPLAFTNRKSSNSSFSNAGILEQGRGDFFWVFDEPSSDAGKIMSFSLCDSFQAAYHLDRGKLAGLPLKTHFTLTRAMERALEQARQRGCCVPDGAELHGPVALPDGCSVLAIEKALAKDFDLLTLKDVRIFDTKNGRRNIHEIYDSFQNGTPIAIGNCFPVGVWHEFDEESPWISFAGIVNAIVAHLFLGVEITAIPNMSLKSGVVTVGAAAVGPLSPCRDGRLDYFPPLFFAPYANSTVLKISLAPLNEKHDFSKWLISAAPYLSEKRPSIFNTLQRLAAAAPGWREREDARLHRAARVTEINGLLKELRKILPCEVAPPDDLELVPEDFSL